MSITTLLFLFVCVHIFDLLNEPRISLTDLAQREKRNVCTVWRWTTRGVAGVRLESFAIGHHRYTTSPGAFERWVAAVTSAKTGEPIPSRSNRRREADQRRAKAELIRDGLFYPPPPSENPDEGA